MAERAANEVELKQFYPTACCVLCESKSALGTPSELKSPTWHISPFCHENVFNVDHLILCKAHFSNHMLSAASKFDIHRRNIDSSWRENEDGSLHLIESKIGSRAAPSWPTQMHSAHYQSLDHLRNVGAAAMHDWQGMHKSIAKWLVTFNHGGSRGIAD